MDLVIVRHGKAERDSFSGRDEDRKLTRRGERQALWLGEALSESGFTGARVLSSRAARAIRTAHLLAEGLMSPVEEAEGLMLGSQISDVLPLMEMHRSGTPLVLVGHNPMVSQLASLLTHGVGFCELQLRTGSAAMIELTELVPGAATLRDVLRLQED